METFRQAYENVHTPENIDTYCAENFTVEQAKTQLYQKQIMCKIAYKDQSPVGFYTLNFKACPFSLGGSSAELKQIYILKREFGTGLGRELFDDAVDTFKVQNIEWMWLSVSDWNTRAQDFYKKLEFEKLGCGPTFEVGTDRLPSSILGKRI